jgi:hypothetical protein
MTRFGQDFPGAVVQQLAFNYRSQEPVVETVAAFDRTMQLSGTPTWEAVRGHRDGEVFMRVAADGDAEGDGIARETLHCLQDERGAGRAPDERAALDMLAEVWIQRGPKDHLYESEYRRMAETMIRRAIGQAWRPPRRTDVQPQWEVPLTHGVVSVTPDRIVEDGDELVVQRLRTGKPTQSEASEDIYAVSQAAGAQALPGVPTRLETLYLATGEVREVQVSEKSARTRLAHYDSAIEGILRREFPPKPNDRRCPRCPHYFICPAGGDSRFGTISGLNQDG